ncbi:hypothetical protein ACYFX5_13995 [Bremerella sp. T1]|uniref:hypothetical protein n=1 Tax=Bremerella sp. TYQ1 TaxID=3119568 RepID=UPI001CCA2075|nr:hypothetical protein [Bremerella volcania]UBM34169.1 hypothetical protein LA756_15935 [Bremerella volcania]
MAILSLVYSYGVCPGGCLEENQWYAAVHDLVEHCQALPECAHEHAPDEHCDCDQKADTPLLVSARTVDNDAPQAIAWVPNIDVQELLTASTFSTEAIHMIQRAGPPSRTLRAQSQLFRC